MPPSGIEPATPSLSASPSNHSALRRDIDMSFKLLQYFLKKDTTITPYRVQGIFENKKKNKNKRTLFTYSHLNMR